VRDSKRSLLISGGLSACGSAMITTGAILHESQGESALSGSLIFIGLMIAPLSIGWFISSLVGGIRKEALEKGAGEIARLTLSAAEWAAFRAQETRWVSAGRPVNILNMRSGEPKTGEVIFAKRAVIVDEDYQDLTPGGLVDLRGVEFVPGSPSCLEFSMRAQKGRGASGTGGGFTYLWLRVPIAGGDTREGIKVFQHYRATTQRRPAIAMRNPKLTMQVCLGLTLVCGLAAMWGMSNTETRAYGDAPLYAAVIGVIVGLAALLLAAIVLFRVRMEKS